MLTRRDVLKRMMASSAAGLLPSAGLAALQPVTAVDPTTQLHKTTQRHSTSRLWFKLEMDHASAWSEVVVRVSFRYFNDDTVSIQIPFGEAAINMLKERLAPGGWYLAMKQRKALKTFIMHLARLQFTMGRPLSVGLHNKILGDVVEHRKPTTVEATWDDYQEVGQSSLVIQLATRSTEADRLGYYGYLAVYREGYMLPYEWRLNTEEPFRRGVFNSLLCHNDWRLSDGQLWELHRFQTALVDHFETIHGKRPFPSVYSNHIGCYLRRQVISSSATAPVKRAGFGVVPSRVAGISRILWEEPRPGLQQLLSTT